MIRHPAADGVVIFPVSPSLLVYPCVTLAVIRPSAMERDVTRLADKDRFKRGLARVRFNASLTRTAPSPGCIPG